MSTTSHAGVAPTTVSTSSSATSGITRRSLIAGAAGAAAASLLASLGVIDARPSLALAADGARTFTYAIAGDPGANVNPVTTNDRYGLMVLKLLFSQLYVVRNDGVTWFLATSCDESDDHLTYTMHLREGVTWSDGQPFTADDVVFSYQTTIDREEANAHDQFVYDDGSKVTVEKVDDHTVAFTLPTQNAAGLENLTGVYVMPKHVYEGVSDFANNDVNANPVGTGPFTLKDYQAGSYVQFAARSDYFDGTPGVDSIVFQIITNENTGMQAIQTGQVDAWIATAAEAQQMDAQGNGLTITPYSENRVAYFTFNTTRVTDERVRKALFYALDKQAIADAAVLDRDYYELEYTFLPTGNGFYAPDAVERYDRDVEKAKQLLADAGQPNPTFVFAYTGSDTLQTNAVVLIQEQAAEAGITIDLRGIDSSAISAAQRDKDSEYDIIFGGYIMGVDPDEYASHFTSGSTRNFAHYDDPVVDDLFAQGRVETDDAKRHEIYDQLQAEIQEHASFYPLYSNDRLLVTTARVGGIDEAKLVQIYTFEEWDKLTVSE